MRTFVLTSVLLTLAFASLGCVQGEDDTAVVILFNIFPEASEGDGTCTLSADEGADYLPRGFIDTNLNRGYQFFPLIKNFAESRPTDVGSEKLAFVEGADIHLRVYGESLEGLDTAGLLAFSQRFSATVSADGGTTAASFVLVPQELLRRMGERLPTDGSRATIEATIQLFGRLGGGDFRSQEYVYWVDVCKGCGSFDVGQGC